MPSDQFAVSVVDGVVHVEGEIDSHVAPAFDNALVATAPLSYTDERPDLDPAS